MVKAARWAQPEKAKHERIYNALFVLFFFVYFKTIKTQNPKVET